MQATLYYILDPMCSWCWGFSPRLKELIPQLPEDISVQYVMGGLAPDSEQPMPEETREYIQIQWRLVTEKTGAEFNWDFWEKCQPRRSTYPACRAVIASGLQGQGYIPQMISAIQKAYYLEARNPSDQDTLVELAAESGLDQDAFGRDIQSIEVEELLQQDFQTRHQLGVRSFPTLMLATSGTVHNISLGVDTPENMLSEIHAARGTTQ